MQSEEEISTQLPPPIEELDQAMGATQLGDNDDDVTAPPSPSLVPMKEEEKEKKKKKKTHLPPLHKSPIQ